MDIDQLYALIQKYREHRCSEDELQQLDNWYGLFDDEADRIPSVPDEKLEYLLSRIEQKIEVGNTLNAQNKEKNRLRTVLSWVGGVAAILAICLITGYYLMPPTDDTPVNQIIASIPPGSQQAELILEDGSKVSLSNTTVVKDKEGQLLKKDSSSVLDYTAVAEASAKNRFNTIAVPLGGEYSVILADGTQVWLNSGSSLKYPVVFSGEKREVRLTGEAFFKVTKSKISFIVKTSNIDIKVLGTSFNISAYESDDRIRTTLVNGSVIVSSNHDDQEYKLTPGHSLSYTKATNQVAVEECDTDLYTSWMDGEFKFRDMRLEDIMIKISRWYDCQVIYEDKSFKDLCFSGSAERGRPANYLLALIETITPVHFEIQEDRIIVKKK